MEDMVSATERFQLIDIQPKRVDKERKEKKEKKGRFNKLRERLLSKICQNK